MELMIDNDVVFGCFVVVVEVFSVVLGWWDCLFGFGDFDLVFDVKKEGIFLIVYGVCSFVLVYCIFDEIGIVLCLDVLVWVEVFDVYMVVELSESLYFLMMLWFKVGLVEIDVY